MAFQEGSAGKSTRQFPQKRFFKKIVVPVASLFFSLLLYYLTHNGIFSIVGLLLFLYLNNRFGKEVWIYRKSKQRTIKGAKAEEEIGQILAKLPKGYAVFHDVLSNLGNIDHIILSRKQGIFLLETKSHNGTVTTDGKYLYINGHLPEKNFIEQINNNVMWLKETLKYLANSDIKITPIIVFTNAFVDISVYKPVMGITVLNKKILLKIIASQPENNAETIKIYAILKQRLQHIEETVVTHAGSDSIRSK